MQFKSEPYPHQSVAYEKHKDQPFFLLAMDMGTGKSKIAIDVACHKYEHGEIDQVLLFAPNGVHAQWVNEQLPEHCSLPFTPFIWRADNTHKYKSALSYFLWNQKDCFRWFAVHIDSLSTGTSLSFIAEYLGHTNNRTLVIVDEASRIKNHTTERFKRLLALRRKYPVVTCALTGTPMAKNATDVWAIYEFLQPRYIGCSFTAFNRKHSITHLRRVGAGKRMLEDTIDEKTFWFVKKRIERKAEEFSVYNPNIFNDMRPVYNELTYAYNISVEDLEAIHNSAVFIRSKNIDQLKQYVAPVTTFARKVDCVKLPEKIYEEHLLSPPAEYVRLLKELKAYAVATYGDKELTITHKALLQLRARQICGGFFPYDVGVNLKGEMEYATSPINADNPKLNFLKEDIPEIGEQQFIIWAVFPNEIIALTSALAEFGVAALYGDVKMEQRNNIIGRFNAGEINGIIANPAVMAYGFNLQKAEVQYWYSRDFRTEARLQGEDRSHRIGISRSPVYKDLLYDVASEKAVLQCIKQGTSMNDYFKTRGIEEILAV
jgi:SNF2 family DNA or RNA helicase